MFFFLTENFMADKKERLYRIVFLNQDEIYELYAKGLSESEMFGFLEIEDIVFGENSSVLVDPAEEKLKAEFEGVRRVYVPVHSVIRVDEVEKEGQAKIRDAGDTASNVRHFPRDAYVKDKN